MFCLSVFFMWFPDFLSFLSHKYSANDLNVLTFFSIFIWNIVWLISHIYIYTSYFARYKNLLYLTHFSMLSVLFILFWHYLGYYWACTSIQEIWQSCSWCIWVRETWCRKRGLCIDNNQHYFILCFLCVFQHQTLSILDRLGQYLGLCVLKHPLGTIYPS